MEKNRKKLLAIDKKIIELLAKRQQISKKIGEIKLKNNIDPLQNNYWQQTEEIRKNWASEKQINENFVKNLFNMIRKESLKIQKLRKGKNEK